MNDSSPNKQRDLAIARSVEHTPEQAKVESRKPVSRSNGAATRA